MFLVLWRRVWSSGRVRVCVGGRAFESCLGVFLRLVALSSTLSSPDPLSSGLPQSSPSLSGTPHGFPYCGSLLRRWVRSTAGAAILCLLSPDVGGLPSVCQSVVSLTDPPLTRTPRSCGSGGSSLVCLNHDPNQNSKAFRRR